MNKIIFDLDDFSAEHNCLRELIKLKNILPNLKVNLFTIPMKTSFDILWNIKQNYDWIQLIYHGVEHDDNYEFARLNYEEADSKLSFLERSYGYFFVKGFKPPGWQVSKDVMQVLKDKNWWFATQWSDGRLNEDINGPFQPKVLPDLKFYARHEVKPPFKSIHGHTWNTCGNGILELWDELIKIPKKTEFVFIEDYVNQNLSG